MLALLATSGPAAAAPKPITGKLSKPGLTVIALDKNGEAATKPVGPNGTFKLKPPAKRISLHLRAADGTYAGPVVIDRKGKKGRKAILGVKAGAELGKVRVRDGYAKVKEDLPREAVDRKRKARAKKGVPIGAGNFGRVAAAATGTAGPGQDLDRDGIPGALDIDDDGDLVLDGIDAPASASTATSAAAAARGPQPRGEFGIHPLMGVTLGYSANSNAGSSDEEIEAALPRFGVLMIAIAPGGPAELDCAGDPQANPPRPGLRYCSTDGTGRVDKAAIGAPDLQPFPGPPFGEFDPDGDGFGALFDAPFPPVGFFSLLHGAVARRPDLDPTISRIGAGDILVQRVATDGGESEFVGTLPFVFASAPALVSYSDTAGNSGTVDYSGGPQQAFPVSAPPGEDVVVTLTFFRPQRRPIPDELCPPPDGPVCAPNQWIDIGHLTYGAGIADIAQTGPRGQCPQSAFTATDGTELTPPEAFGSPGAGLTDQADDHLASGNSFTYRLNLTECLQGTSWNEGEVASLNFDAHTKAFSDTSLVGVRFKLE